MGQLIVLVILLCASLTARSEQGPLVAAASSLRTLWQNLSESYTNDTGNSAPRASFASSGLLSTQIINGAPFELFLSADLESIDRLNNLQTPESTQIYALGELALVAPRNNVYSEPFSLSSLAMQIRQSKNRDAWRLSIPNPVHAPYGRAARAALQSVNLWPLPDGHLLAAENAAQTLQFVKSGAVAAALVPRSLLNESDDKLVIAFLPHDSYPPVEHAVALLQSHGDSARAFHDWLLSDKSHALLKKAGLRLPAP